MPIKLSDSDWWFISIGIGLIFIGFWELIDNDGYNKNVGFWLLGGCAIIIFSFLDAVVRKPTDTK